MFAEGQPMLLHEGFLFFLKAEAGYGGYMR